MAKCAECGAVVADDLKFCGYCGAKLNVIGEHLGTQILGNTEVIMGALARILPGGVQGYILIGKPNDGPFAGGLILGRHDGHNAKAWWSDGDKLTHVAVSFVLDLWDRDALEISPDLVDTCPNCLSTYHRTRRLDSGWDKTENQDNVHGLVFRWLVDWEGNGCPSCSALKLTSEEIRSKRIGSIRGEFSRRKSELEERVKMCREAVHNKRYPRASRQRSREQAVATQREAQILAQLAAQLPARLEQSVDADFDAFRKFARTLPGALLEPTESTAVWKEYQGHFERAQNLWTLADYKGNPYCHLPWAMRDDAEVSRIVRQLEALKPY